MAAMCTNLDGNYVFVALEDVDTGFPVIVKASRLDLSTWSIIYNPGAGSAANIWPCRSNPDLMFFYGNFGSGIQVIRHTISTITNTNISPSGLTTKVVNTLEDNPSNASEIVITVNTDQDLKYTLDGGATWSNWDAALGFNATALKVMWSGAYSEHRYFVAGQVGVGNLDLLYSPNEGVSDSNRENASLAAKANITNVEVVEA